MRPLEQTPAGGYRIKSHSSKKFLHFLTKIIFYLNTIIDNIHTLIKIFWGKEEAIAYFFFFFLLYINPLSLFPVFDINGLVPLCVSSRTYIVTYSA